MCLAYRPQNPAEITVTGPEDLLAQIKSARATITLGQVSGSVNDESAADARGRRRQGGHVKLHQDADDRGDRRHPRLPADNLPLTLGFRHGYYNPGNVHISWSPETILLMGRNVRHRKRAVALYHRRKGIPGDGAVYHPHHADRGLTNVSGITEATLTIKHIGTTTKQITLTNFAVINPENFSYSLVTDELNVTLQGTPTNLSYISDKNVTATIDLSGFKNPERQRHGAGHHFCAAGSGRQRIRDRNLLYDGETSADFTWNYWLKTSFFPSTSRR